MTRLLLKKYLWESALLWFACALMLLIFCWVRVWIICQFDLQQFEPLLQQLRPFERFLPVPLEQLLTYAGSLALTFDEPVLILCIVVWVISRGSDVVSGELSRGTLEMLLAQPIRRTHLILVHGSVVVVGLLGLCGAVWMGLYLGIQTNTIRETIRPSFDIAIPLTTFRVPIPFGTATEVEGPLASRVDPALYLAPTINLFCFGFFLLGASVCCSCFDRYRWRTIGLVVGFYVIELLLYLLSRASELTQFTGYLTFFSCYQPAWMVHMVRENPSFAWHIFGTELTGLAGRHAPILGPLGMSLTLLVLGIGLHVVGILRFRRRDLPAPT